MPSVFLSKYTKKKFKSCYHITYPDLCSIVIVLDICNHFTPMNENSNKWRACFYSDND